MFGEEQAQGNRRNHPARGPSAAPGGCAGRSCGCATLEAFNQEVVGDPVADAAATIINGGSPQFHTDLPRFSPPAVAPEAKPALQ